MKKILFLQLEGNALGGVWYVNKTLGEEFVKRGYDVTCTSIRNAKMHGYKDNASFKLRIINEKDSWARVHKRDVLNSIFKLRFFRTLIKYFTDKNKLNEDYLKLSKFISEYDPDYIIASHYEVLGGIPEKYLAKTIHVQHTSFKKILDDLSNIKTLKKYNEKLHLLMWLSEGTLSKAKDLGFNKNDYIYNPIRFSSSKADVCLNKKLVVITRFSPEKRINLMLDIAKVVLDKNPDWCFELYGNGNLDEEAKKIIENSSRINYRGLTDDPKKVLKSSSINLNTSIYEGMSLSILEALECGIPTVTFDIGESTGEEVKNNETGFVVNSKEEYIDKLDSLMKDEKKLEKFSLKAKEFAKNFSVNKVVDKWINVFENMDKRN